MYYTSNNGKVWTHRLLLYYKKNNAKGSELQNKRRSHSAFAYDEKQAILLHDWHKVIFNLYASREFLSQRNRRLRGSQNFFFYFSSMYMQTGTKRNQSKSTKNFTVMVISLQPNSMKGRAEGLKLPSTSAR